MKQVQVPPTGSMVQETPTGGVSKTLPTGGVVLTGTETSVDNHNHLEQSKVLSDDTRQPSNEELACNSTRDIAGVAEFSPSIFSPLTNEGEVVSNEAGSVMTESLKTGAKLTAGEMSAEETCSNKNLDSSVSSQVSSSCSGSSSSAEKGSQDSSHTRSKKVKNKKSAIPKIVTK